MASYVDKVHNAINGGKNLGQSGNMSYIMDLPLIKSFIAEGCC